MRINGARGRNQTSTQKIEYIVQIVKTNFQYRHSVTHTRLSTEVRCPFSTERCINKTAYSIMLRRAEAPYKFGSPYSTVRIALLRQQQQTYPIKSEMDVMGVRRQHIWHRCRRKLTECWPHLVD